MFRYLGYGRGEPDSSVIKAVRECAAKMEPQLTPRYITRIFDLERDAETLRIESMEIRSRSLSSNLEGCEKVCLMAATLGLAPDRLASRASAQGKMSEAVMYQAIGAAYIEKWCDTVNDSVAAEARREGWYAKPRFSPGYGDFPLEYQTAFFEILQIPRRIGVTLTKSLMMVPSKSVTAVIGLSEAQRDSHGFGCGEAGPGSKCTGCEKAGSCSYSRN